MMFWRVLWRLMSASRARLAVALVALVSGAAVVSAFASLELDMDRKLAAQFRTLGANILVAPPEAPGAVGEAALLPESLWQKSEARPFLAAEAVGESRVVAAAPFLYFIAQAQDPATGQERQLVAAGTLLDQLAALNPSWKRVGQGAFAADSCLVGRKVARQFHLAPGSRFALRYAGRSATLAVAGIITAGSAEDDQVFLPLALAQQVAGEPGKISVIELSVAGTSEELRGALLRLRGALAGADVRPIAQLTSGEARLVGRIHLLVLATIVMILVLTVLGVLATMAALAAERRVDVGLMKAIGGPMRRVLRLFLAEVGILGGLGGLIGYPLGVALSRWIGQRVFGVEISIRPEVLPLTILLMLGAALAGALPLRILGRVQPAAILRGE
jgi:putative ABC transport system permease protein